MNLGQRKIHLWRASATLLLCTIATGTPPSVLRRCFPRKIRSSGAFLNWGLSIISKISAQAIVPAQVTMAATVEVERVIVTGSNIPTAEETGPNPVDTYRPADIEKLGIRNATDLTTFLPQEAGRTVNLNIANGGDGTVQFNLRGLFPKETLVLVDGKRVAYGSLGVAGASQSVDINLIPFPMIDA